MTLYFNTAVVKEGGQPTPVEEPWFEFKMTYNDQEGYEGYTGHLRPTKKTNDEWIKFYALEAIKSIEGAVLDSCEGDFYNNIGLLVKEDNHSYYTLRPYYAWCDDDLHQDYWFKATYHVGEGSEQQIERSVPGMKGEFWGEIPENATCGYITLGYDVGFGGCVSRSDIPDWDINHMPLVWEFDVTWNENGSFNLTNFKLIYDAEGNRHE